jgi:homoserine kinase type II
MPGEATFENDPSDAKLEHVMVALAKFHLGSAQVNLGFEKSKNAFSRMSSLRDAPAVIAEIGRANLEFPSEAVNQLRQIVSSKGAAHASELAAAIDPLVTEVFPIQPVIRDCWHDHILFSGDEVTGLVDFGAMQMDNVALDLARVLGSLIGNERERWPTALETYSQLRPLSFKEIEFIYALDRCAAFLGGINWLKWIGLERRAFESPEQVEKRIRHLIGRLV